MTRLLLLLFLLLASCEDKSTPPLPQPPGTQAATEWELGPECANDQGSCGVPLHPTRTAEGAVIDVPQQPSHVNYVTRATGSLAGKTSIRMVIRVELPEGVEIRATKPRDVLYPGIITPYFQRAGDTWRGDATTNWYRWFANDSMILLREGTHEITARFDDRWGAISYGASRCAAGDNNDPDCLGPMRFREALANAGRVGFVLGGGDGAGHGIHATGPGARIVIVSFEIN